MNTGINRIIQKKNNNNNTMRIIIFLKYSKEIHTILFCIHFRNKYSLEVFF